MADPVSQFLEVASREVAKRELGYDQKMIEEDPEKAEAVIAVGKRFMDDVDDIVLKMTASLAEKYNLKHIPDKMVISLYEAIATEAYLGNISLKSIESNEFVQSRAETEAKEQKRVEVVEAIMDKCVDAAFAYTVASAVSYSAIETLAPEKAAFIAAKTAVMNMNTTKMEEIRTLLEDYYKSNERFLEKKNKTSLLLKNIENVETDTTKPGFDSSEVDKVRKDVARLKAMMNEEKRDLHMNKGGKKKKKPSVYKSRTAAYDSLKLYLVEVFNENEIDRENIITEFESRISKSFPMGDNDPQDYTDYAQDMIKKVRGELGKAMSDEHFLSVLINLAADIGPPDKSFAYRQYDIKRAIDESMTKPIEEVTEDIEKITKESKIYAGSDNREENARLLEIFTKFEKAHHFPTDVSKEDIINIIMRSEDNVANAFRENLERLSRQISDGPEKVAMARDALHKFDILRSARININGDSGSKEKMLAIMLSKSVMLLEQGVPADELKESLKGAIKDSEILTPEECLGLFDNLNDAKSKEEVKKVIGSKFETLNLDGIQPGDGDYFLELSTGTVTKDSIIQDNIRYAEMCARVKNKDALSNAERYMKLLEDPVWIEERHNGLELLLLEIRTTEPELHEYMLSRLEKVDQSLRIDRINDRVDKVARKKGLYHETEDGRFEIDGEEYNRLYDKYEKLTKGTYADLIAHEREEAQKLREEREQEQEKEETSPVVEVHSEEKPVEQPEKNQEDQSKPERDDDDYTM